MHAVSNAVSPFKIASMGLLLGKYWEVLLEDYWEGFPNREIFFPEVKLLLQVIHSMLGYLY